MQAPALYTVTAWLALVALLPSMTAGADLSISPVSRFDSALRDRQVRNRVHSGLTNVNGIRYWSLQREDLLVKEGRRELSLTNLDLRLPRDDDTRAVNAVIDLGEAPIYIKGPPGKVVHLEVGNIKYTNDTALAREPYVPGEVRVSVGNVLSSGAPALREVNISTSLPEIKIKRAPAAD